MTGPHHLRLHVNLVLPPQHQSHDSRHWSARTPQQGLNITLLNMTPLDKERIMGRTNWGASRNRHCVLCAPCTLLHAESDLLACMTRTSPQGMAHEGEGCWHTHITSTGGGGSLLCVFWCQTSMSMGKRWPILAQVPSNMHNYCFCSRRPRACEATNGTEREGDNKDGGREAGREQRLIMINCIPAPPAPQAPLVQ